jgi:hypothetical protein
MAFAMFTPPRYVTILAGLGHPSLSPASTPASSSGRDSPSHPICNHGSRHSSAFCLISESLVNHDFVSNHSLPKGDEDELSILTIQGLKRTSNATAQSFSRKEGGEFGIVGQYREYTPVRGWCLLHTMNDTNHLCPTKKGQDFKKLAAITSHEDNRKILAVEVEREAMEKYMEVVVLPFSHELFRILANYLLQAKLRLTYEIEQINKYLEDTKSPLASPSASPKQAAKNGQFINYPRRVRYYQKRKSHSMNDLRRNLQGNWRSGNNNWIRPAQFNLTQMSEVVRYEHSRWVNLETKLAKLFPPEIKERKAYPLVPRNFREFMLHMHGLKIAGVKFVTTQLASLKIAPLPGSIIPLAGKTFGSPNSMRNPSNLSTVLARETIWAPGYAVPWVDRAEWPSVEEMAWEGPSRIQTEQGRFGRMLPLPRLGPTSPEYSPDYKNCPRVQPTSFDDVHPVPDYESIHYPPEPISDKEGKRWVTADLMKILNEPQS